MLDPYPYEEKRKVEALISSLRSMTATDPEQEVQGIALPVLDVAIASIRRAVSNDPVVQAMTDVISPELVESGEPVRAVDALLVAEQLDAAIGRWPVIIA